MRLQRLTARRRRGRPPLALATVRQRLPRRSQRAQPRVRGASSAPTLQLALRSRSSSWAPCSFLAWRRARASPRSTRRRCASTRAGLRLPSAADAASPGNMELDGGALQFRAGGARAVAAAAAEAEARRLSAATGNVHEAVSVVTIDGTESQSGIQSLLPASVPDLPDWQRTRGWMDHWQSPSRALAACSCMHVLSLSARATRRPRRVVVRVDAAMHGRCLLSALHASVRCQCITSGGDRCHHVRAVGHFSHGIAWQWGAWATAAMAVRGVGQSRREG